MTSVSKRSDGFTIVELMIASAVFSVIILAITAALTTMSRAYQRSIYTSNTQAAASSMADVIAQSVRSSTGEINPPTGDAVNGTGAYCIGSQQILYTLGRRVGDTVSTTSSRYAVVARPNNGCGITDIHTNSPVLTGHKELLGRGMRLSNLTIVKPTGSTYYQINLRVVYGDDDLLCRESMPSTCLAGPNALSPAELKSNDLGCKQGIGSEYCSVSVHSSKVYQRY